MKDRLPAPAKRAGRAVKRRWLRWRQRRSEAAAGVTAPSLPNRPVPPSTSVRLYVGPANFAGQGWAWARAAERNLPGVGAEVMALDTGAAFAFPADERVPVALYRSIAWEDAQEDRLRTSFTHVLIEAGRPVLGVKYGNDCRGELAPLRRDGLSVALVSHGSDARLPSRHAAAYPHSPFPHAPDKDVVRRLEEQADRVGRIYAAALDDGIPVFVSTPDLLDDVPGSTWLPVVVDPDGWTSSVPPMERERPVVLFAPSNAWIKGGDHVDPVLRAMDEDGVIEYRRIEGIAAADMPGFIGDADVVVDQIMLGAYGAMAVQAMAAGRVVLGHVADRVRGRIPEPCPIVETVPGQVRQVMDGLLADRAAARVAAASGPAFVRALHDGRYAAGVLAPWLGVAPRGT